jgi:hypothetical protein
MSSVMTIHRVSGHAAWRPCYAHAACVSLTVITVMSIHKVSGHAA